MRTAFALAASADGAGSAASSVDGSALLRFAWALLVLALAAMVKTELEKHFDLGRARIWLREKFFQVMLVRSRPSTFATTSAEVLMSWLSRLPGISEEQVQILDPEEHERGLRQVVACALAILWGAYTDARCDDRTLQFGMWLRVAGVATVALAVQFALAGSSPALIRMEFALGLSLLGVGHFLGALRYRQGLWGALLVLAVVAVIFDTRLAVPAGGALLYDILHVLRQAGSLGAATASVLVATSTRVPSMHTRSRAVLIRWGMRIAGLGCLCYSLANLMQAFMPAPTMVVQATHLVIAASLAMAAAECRHPVGSYSRLTSN